MRAFISDCEGPISKNDNAFEITSNFVPNGDRLFTVISGYDDALADLIKRPGHRAGSTLKFVLPFLMANGMTDQKMNEFSSRNLILMPHAEATLEHVRSIAHSFVVSTSYEHYVRALCQAIRFPFENTYCTRLKLDKYGVTEQEKIRLTKIAGEIVKMPQMEIPPKVKRVQDLPIMYQEAIRSLDTIFREISRMECGRVYLEVEPVGGTEKAEAVKDVAEDLKIELSDVMYIGDSITDDEAFKLVRSGGGLTVSFNGNQYAINNAEVAVLSNTTLVTAAIAHIFIRYGKARVLELADNWNAENLKKSGINPSLLEKLFSLSEIGEPKVRIITQGNMGSLTEESTVFRKMVRGEIIGGLG